MKQPLAFLGAALASLSSAFAAPTAAKNPTIIVYAPPDTVTYEVSYDELNLATAEGQKTLYRQVSTAVVSLCDETSDGDQSTRAYATVHRDCQDRAWREATPQILSARARAFGLAAAGAPGIATGTVTIRARK